MDKEFIKIQLALFFKSDYEGPFESASLKIKEQFGNDLNAQIIGVPNNAPSEFPRVIINSPIVNINLSKNRIDFFSDKNTFVQDFFEKVWNIVSSLSLEIGRVGVVITFFKEIATDDFKEIFNQSKIESLNPQEITVRFNERIQTNGINANNSQMYVTGSAKNDQGIEKKGVIITRDINTHAEDLKKNSFTKETLNSFISEAVLLADKVLV